MATITGVALAGVVLLCFKAGPPAVLALAAVAVTLATAEIFGSLRVAGYSPATLLGLLAVPGVMVAAYFKGPTAIPVGVRGLHRPHDDLVPRRHHSPRRRWPTSR